MEIASGVGVSPSVLPPIVVIDAASFKAAIDSADAATSGATVINLADVPHGASFQAVAGGVAVTKVPATTIGVGPDTIALAVSEDAYLGDAQFTVSVDGAQVGGVQTVVAQHAAGQTQVFDILGTFNRSKVVTVNFLNDAYGGSPSLDRNLYVDSLTDDGAFAGINAPYIAHTYDGLTYGSTAIGAEEYAAGPLTFALNTPVLLGPTVVGSGADSFILNMSEDAYTTDGATDALFAIFVDGVQIGAVQTAAASHALGQSRQFAVHGTFGAGPHTIGVEFLNDAYGGSAALDRNLYVDSIQSGSQTYGGLVLYAAGTQTAVIQIPPSAVTLGSGPDSIVLDVSEDAYASGGQTDAQFTISVDGKQIGETQTAQALRSQGKTEAFVVLGAFGAGAHTVSVNFLNDAYGGSSGQDRNLFVDKVVANGVVEAEGSVLSSATPVLSLFSGGTQSLGVQLAPSVTTLGTGPDAFNLHLSEVAASGDVQFTVTVNGVQYGGVQTVTAQNSAGQDQIFTLLGTFSSFNYPSVVLNFLNGTPVGTPDNGRRLISDDRSLQLVVDGGGEQEAANAGLVPILYGPPYSRYPDIGTVQLGSGPDTITVNLGQQGVANRFTISLDGSQLGDYYYASSIVLQGSFAPGPHVVTINNLEEGNDRQSGQAVNVQNITYNGLSLNFNTNVYTSQSFVVQPLAATLTGSSLTGPGGGYAILYGTTGDDTIVAQGTANHINGLGGNDTVIGSPGGGDTITLNATSDTTATRDRVLISGANNSVTAEDASVNLSGTASNTNVALGNGNDTVQLTGPGASVVVGEGDDTLTLLGGGVSLVVDPDPNNIHRASNDVITLSGQNNYVTTPYGPFLQKYHSLGPVLGSFTVDGGNGNGAFEFGGGTVKLVTDGLNNVIAFNHSTFPGLFPTDNYDITAGSGFDSVLTVGGVHSAIRLGGSHNTVATYVGDAAITGGTGSSSIKVTNGGANAAVTTGGTLNTVTIDNGQATVDPGSSSDTVSLIGTAAAAVIFHGDGDMLFLHTITDYGQAGAVTAGVNDQSTDLQVFIDPGLVSLTLSQFGAAGVIHLLSGAGGYTTAAQALAALKPDSGGGTMLAVDTGVVHFGAGITLGSGNFSIG